MSGRMVGMFGSKNVGSLHWQRARLNRGVLTARAHKDEVTVLEVCGPQ